MDYLKALKEVNDLIEKIEFESMKEARKVNVEDKSNVDVGKVMGHGPNSEVLKDFYKKIKASNEKK